MILLIPPRRLARAGEWTRGSAIMFLVTLAATGTVTLAARAAGMSRKSAYALKKRDPFFAAAWQSAKTAAVRSPDRPAKGNTADRVTRSISSIGESVHGEALEWRHRFLAELRRARDSTRATAALAPHRSTQ